MAILKITEKTNIPIDISGLNDPKLIGQQQKFTYTPIKISGIRSPVLENVIKISGVGVNTNILSKPVRVNSATNTVLSEIYTDVDTFIMGSFPVPTLFTSDNPALNITVRSRVSSEPVNIASSGSGTTQSSTSGAVSTTPYWS